MDTSSQITSLRLFSSSLEEAIQFPIEKSQLRNSESTVSKSVFEEFTSVKISCIIPLSLYQKIFDQAWLNLNVNPQESIEKTTLVSHLPIKLKLALKIELLPQYLDLAKKAKEAITTKASKGITLLCALSQTQPETREDIHPLLQEQNWYCTTISQPQPNGEEITHHTLWHYLLPTLQNPTPDSIADSITHYITDQTTASLNQLTQATDPLFQDIAQTFQDLFTGTLTDLDTAPESEDSPDTAESSNLLTPLTDFLEAEGWPYAQLPETTTEDTTLRLAFRGENGQWPCYAKINQPQQTLCFYSISPITAEPIYYPAIAEFITRANYGTILGNFELDYSDGEIRYKTGIDVEGDTLTTALLQNLIYTNVMMMDQYLPGLLAVLEQGLTPAQAIHLIEQSDAISA